MRSSLMWRTGSIILIGATTENPSFEINCGAAFPLQGVRAAARWKTEDLVELLRRALARSSGASAASMLRIAEGTAGRLIAEFAAGDARTALNTLEMAVLNAVERRRMA